MGEKIFIWNILKILFFGIDMNSQWINIFVIFTCVKEFRNRFSFFWARAERRNFNIVYLSLFHCKIASMLMASSIFPVFLFFGKMLGCHDFIAKTRLFFKIHPWNSISVTISLQNSVYYFFTREIHECYYFIAKTRLFLLSTINCLMLLFICIKKCSDIGLLTMQQKTTQR